VVKSDIKISGEKCPGNVAVLHEGLESLEGGTKTHNESTQRKKNGEATTRVLSERRMSVRESVQKPG